MFRTHFPWSRVGFVLTIFGSGLQAVAVVLATVPVRDESAVAEVGALPVDADSPYCHPDELRRR
jgi:hypothetical protein